MKIINDVDFITNEQIQSCVDLLHYNYHNLVNKIHVYNDWNSFYSEHKEYIDKNEYGQVSSLGVHDANLNNVYVLPFNYEIEEEFYIHQTTSIIFHELRHAWQKKYKPKLYHKYDDIYISYGKGYMEQWIERDACLFEHRMYFKYFDSLYNILK